MPPIIHLRSETDRATLRRAFERMREELDAARPGSTLIAQQLATMIPVQALRLHLDAVGEGASAGCRHWRTAMSARRSRRSTASPIAGGR